MHIEVTRSDHRLPAVSAMVAAAEDELDRRYGRDGADHGLVGSEEFAPPTGAFVVARLNGHLAGGCGLRQIAAPKDRIGEVKRLWVRPDLRRRGVAAQLMLAIESAARDAGLVRLVLETGPRQPEAHDFYVKEGWTIMPTMPTGGTCHPQGTFYEKWL